MPRAVPDSDSSACGAMAAGRGGSGGGSVSARALARSVAHRLKYYIDVQRKENSFDSSGLIRDEMESSSCYTHPACQIEWEHDRPLEHDFAEIKLEASLRTYMGSTKECHQKVQESPEKRKNLEKFIKEMARVPLDSNFVLLLQTNTATHLKLYLVAMSSDLEFLDLYLQDYVPDQMNEGRAKKTQRQSYWLRTPSSLHRTANPSMSAEEVRRLVSSASKLIVAATSEVSPKVLGTTREAVSTPKRRATKIIPNLDCAWKQSLSSTRPHRDEAGSTQDCHEEFKTELNQRASENGRKKPKATKKRKNVKYRERPTEVSSNISCQSNRVLSTMLPKSNDLCSASVSFPSPYSPPGRNKVFRKGILKNRRSLSCTSSEISEYQNAEPDSHWKGSPRPPAGRSRKLVEIKRRKSSCTPIGVASRRRSSRQPVLTSRNTPEVIRNNMEVMHAQSSKVSKKTGKTYNSNEDSGCAVLHGPSKEMCDRGNRKREFSGKSQRDWPEETKGDLSSASEKNSECHGVHFQMLQQWCHHQNAEQKHHSDGCSLDNFGQPENTTLPVASGDEASEILAGLQDQDQDHTLTVPCDPTLGYPVCWGEDQEAPASLPTKESMNTDGTVGNPDINSDSGNLLNQILSLSETDAKAIDDPTSNMQINDLVLGELWDQQVLYIPPVIPGVGETSEEGGSSSASSGMSTPVLGRLENEESDEGFTISSASSRLSAKSLASMESINTNAGLKKGEENADSRAGIRVPNVIQESSTVEQRTFGQHSERLSSSAKGKRTKKDCGPESTSATQVVYFSHLPMSS